MTTPDYFAPSFWRSTLNHIIFGAATNAMNAWILGGIGSVDHICHNKKCVNPGHLRLATNKENQENRSGPTRINSSGVRGVSWFERTGKWRAYVNHNGKQVHLGYFPSKEEAESVAIAKRNELYTHNIKDRVRQ